MVNKISFPEKENKSVNDRLSRDLPVYTIRVSEERGKYKYGEILKTDHYWVIVAKITTINNVKEYEFYNELTKDQVDEIQSYDPPYEVLKLVRVVY